jgi:integrase
MRQKRNAWAEKRGQRFIGRYRDDAGKTKSAGTFDTREQAVAAAERRAGLGQVGDYLDMTLTEYLEHWRDSRLGEEKITPQGKYNHWMTLNRFVIPAYGRKRVRDFQDNPWLAHQVVGSVLSHPKARKSSQQRVRIALGSAFRPLVKMQLLRINPMSGVEYQVAPKRKQPIFKPEDLRAIVDQMPEPAQKACLMFMVYSAMRPGEVFGLRVSHIRFRPNGMAVIDQHKKVVMGIRPGDPEAIEEDGSKTGDGHQVRLSAKQAQMLREHIEREGLSGEDLVFPRRLVAPPIPRKRTDLSGWDPEGDYGWYEDGDKRARHGTTTAYTYGCHCQHCKNAQALYRRQARECKATPKVKRNRSADDYATARHWYPVFKRAVAQAGIEWDGKPYTTRAAAATWMFKAGADLPDVQEALNHKNPATTLIYLRAAKQEEDETVNAALDSVV